MHPFRKLILISLGRADSFEKTLTPRDWLMLLKLAKVQTLIGVLYEGVKRLPEGQEPPQDTAEEWETLTALIARIYRRHERQTVELEGILRKLDLHGCILKGTGLAQLYPLPERRMCGDIDIWVKGRRSHIIRQFRAAGYKVHDILYQECKVDIFDDTVVEVHFRPSKTYSPFRNARLQRILRRLSPIREDAALTVPDARFNAVFCLAHMYRHYLEGGLGMRQMMDYYYVLKDMAPEDRKPVMKMIRWLGFRRFAGAMMTSLKFNFGLEDEYLLCKPDRRLGEKLVKDTIRMGNFGVMDARNRAKEGESRLARFLRKSRRVFSNARYYPGEVLWSPFARMSQHLWRWMMGYLHD